MRSAPLPRALGPWLPRGAFVLLLGLAAGCANPMKRTEGRPALAQRLVAAAAERAVAQIPGDDLRARRLTLRVLSAEKETTRFLEAVVRDRLAAEGALVADNAAPTVAPYELAVTFHAAGTDVESTFYGIPILSMLPGVLFVPGGTGDLTIYSSSTQTGFVRLVARLEDRVSGRTIRAFGPFEGRASYKNFSFLIFFGPFRSDDLPEELPSP